MGLPEKYSYLWTIFKGLPFGIGSIIIGISLLLNTPSDVDDLQKVEGKIEWHGVKSMYLKKLDVTGDVYTVKIGSKYFYHSMNKIREILENEIPAAFKNNDNVVIWFDENNKIEQLSINGKIVVSYKPHGTAIFFICFGVLITIGAIIYAIKYKSDIGFKKK